MLSIELFYSNYVKLKGDINLDIFSKQFNSVYRICYNELLNNKSEKEIHDKLVSYKNIELLDYSWIRNAKCRAETTLSKFNLKDVNKAKKVIFGGRKNFKRRSHNRLSKHKFKTYRNQSIYSVGSKIDLNGNRKVSIDLENNKIILKINKENHFVFNLNQISSNNYYLLQQIYSKAKNREIPLTYNFNLNSKSITIIYDESKIGVIEQFKPYSSKRNRILSLDLNPDNIGLVVSDFNNAQKVIHKEVISFEQINYMYYSKEEFKDKVIKRPITDKQRSYQYNKREFETYEVVQYILKLCKHYKVESIAIEDLNMTTKDKGNIFFNTLVNNFWIRTKFKLNIQKWCNLYNIKLHKMKCQYSSFIGCLEHKSEPDMIAAAIEIGRRANEFNQQYILKTKQIQRNIIFPPLNKELVLNQWKKDGLINKDLFDCETWIQLYDVFKKSKLSYRLTNYEESSSYSFSLKSIKSKLKIYVL